MVGSHLTPCAARCTLVLHKPNISPKGCEQDEYVSERDIESRRMVRSRCPSRHRMDLGATARTSAQRADK